MTWRALVVDDLPRRRFHAVSRVLFDLGAAGVQEEPAKGAAPVLRQPWDDGPPPPPPRRICARAWFDAPDEAAIEAALGDLAHDLRWEDVVEEDWETSWQQGFPAFTVADRLRISPPWEAEPGDLVIEPGQGFGTGQHETTRAVLEALAPIAGGPGATTLLDVGAGSGILALAGARLGMQAEGVDIDPVAVVDADGNARRNQLDVRFSTTPVDEVAGTFDVVVANLFAETLVALSQPLVDRTRHHLILAGVLAEREAPVRAAFDALLGEPTRVSDAGWVCLHYRRAQP